MVANDKLKRKFDMGLHICVGLDTDIKKIPSHLLTFSDPIFEFNKGIINSTKDITAAYKINFAFYESEGKTGMDALEKTLSIIPDDLLTIADAKRGDIGNTSKMYAKAIYEYYSFDSITLHPYMGYDSVKPFLDYAEKLNIILALTSNPSNSDFETQMLNDGSNLYQKVIKKVTEWNIHNNCGIVFGATNPNELEENITSFENLIVLLPGVGSQGGSLNEIVEIFKRNNNFNFLINESRSLIYAGDGKNYSEATRQELINHNSIIKDILK